MFGCDKAPVTNRGGEQHSMRHIKIMGRNSPILAYFNEKKNWYYASHIVLMDKICNLSQDIWKYFICYIIRDGITLISWLF